MRTRGWREWLAPVVLLAGAVALFRIDRSLAASDAESRDMRDRIGRLIRKEEREKIPVAAITVEIGEHEKWTYARQDDRWRVLDATNAVADADSLERLWKSFLEGEGVVQSTDRNRLSEYGFSLKNVIRVALHGPEVKKKKDLDVRWRCELGNRIPDLDGCFVRLEGSSSVWAMDSDPRAIIEGSRRAGLPPLVEGTLISPAVFRSGGPLDTITIEVPGRPALVLRLEQIPIDPTDPEALRGGRDPFRWTATSGGAETTVDPKTAMAFYQVFLGAKAFRLLDPAIAAARGIDTAAGRGESRISLGTAAGPVVSLLVSPPATDGARAIWNTESQVLFEIDAALASLLLPEAAELAVAGAENPWQQHLARENAALQTPQSIEMPPNAK